jgi:hypothetical protein
VATAGLALLLALPPAGCGEPPKTDVFTNQKVMGKVLLDNGRPLTRGRVVLVPLQEPFMQLSGKLGPDGSFSLSAAGLGTGISHGRFQVSIEPDNVSSGGSKPRGLNFPRKYLDPSASGLTVTIGPETTQLPPIELK